MGVHYLALITEASKRSVPENLDRGREYRPNTVRSVHTIRGHTWLVRMHYNMAAFSLRLNLAIEVNCCAVTYNFFLLFRIE